MKKYTFEDWLNDKIDFKSNFLIHRDDGSYSLYHESEIGGKGKLPDANKILPEKEYNKIRKAQEEAFDDSFTMAFESYKKFFLDEISKAEYPHDYLKKQQDEHKKDIDNIPKNAHNSRMLDGVILGAKAFTKIKGSQYREIKAAWGGFKNGKIKYVTNYLNDYLGIYTTYRIYKWLEKYATKEQPESRTQSDIEQTKKRRKEKEINEQLQKAYEYLNYFSGYWNRRRIMSNKDFNKLLKYTEFLIRYETLHSDIKPFSIIGLSGQHIIYTFSKIYNEIYIGKNPEKKILYCNFLHNIFKRLKNWELETIKKKFTTKPLSYDYDLINIQKNSQVI